MQVLVRSLGGKGGGDENLFFVSRFLGIPVSEKMRSDLKQGKTVFWNAELAGSRSTHEGQAG